MPTTPLQTLHQQAAAANMAGSQAAFARFVGWDKAHITRLKQRGQIVMRADGQVDYAATIQQIVDNADPAHDRTRTVNARKRNRAAAIVDKEDPDDGFALDNTVYAEERAREKKIDRMTKQIALDKLVGTLVPKMETEAIYSDVQAMLGAGLLRLPFQICDLLPPQLRSDVLPAAQSATEALRKEWHEYYSRERAQLEARLRNDG